MLYVYGYYKVFKAYSKRIQSVFRTFSERFQILGGGFQLRDSFEMKSYG